MSEAILKIIPNCSDIELIKHISNNTFSYTNHSGTINHDLVYKSYNAYKKGLVGIPHNLFRSNSFFIAKIL